MCAETSDASGIFLISVKLNAEVLHKVLTPKAPIYVRHSIPEGLLA
jgi:hypothetical protein